MRNHLLIGLTAAMLLGGCSPYAPRPEAIRPETKLQPLPAAVPVHTPGSLWSGENSRNMLFTDNKARYVNDIVTIVIDESSSGQNQASTNTSRNSATNAGISAMLGLDTSILQKNPNMGAAITVGGSTANSLKGSGDTSRGGQLKARLTARVVRVLDNGNLLIEGRRQVTLNNEDQYIVVTGLIRPEDITAENAILSSNMADARIVYTGSGVLMDKQHPGWMTRVLDWGWPF